MGGGLGTGCGMSYGSIMPLGTHRKEECHQDRPLFGISSGRESGTVSGVVTGWWGLLEIPVRDKEAGWAGQLEGPEWPSLRRHALQPVFEEKQAVFGHLTFVQ